MEHLPEAPALVQVMCEPLQPRSSLSQQACEHGDIFIVQPAPDSVRLI